MRTTKIPALLGLVAATVAAGDAVAAGLPQLDHTTFSPQVIWLAISFAVLYVLMTRVALPRVGEVLDERAHRISESLRTAETLKGEAEAAAAAYEKALAEARAQAHEVIQEVRERMAEETGRRQKELDERLSAEVAEAEARIAEAHKQAMAEVRTMAVEVTQAASERLIGEALDAKAVGAAVDDALKEAR